MTSWRGLTWRPADGSDAREVFEIVASACKAALDQIEPAAAECTTAIEANDALSRRAQELLPALTSLVDAVEHAPGAARQHAYLVPKDSAVEILRPREIARRGRMGVGQVEFLATTTQSAADGYREVLESVAEVENWLEGTWAQMNANREAAQAIRDAGTVPDALKAGDPIWRWCRQKGEYAQASPEAFRRAANRARRATEHVDPRGLAAQCARVVDAMAEARVVANAHHETLLALTAS